MIEEEISRCSEDTIFSLRVSISIKMNEIMTMAHLPILQEMSTKQKKLSASLMAFHGKILSTFRRSRTSTRRQGQRERKMTK